MASLIESSISLHIHELKDIILPNPSQKNKIELEVFKGGNRWISKILDVESFTLLKGLDQLTNSCLFVLCRVGH